MNVQGIEPSRAEILIAVGDVGGAEDDVSDFRIDDLIADREASPAFGDRENLVVGMDMEGRTFADQVGHVTNQGDAGMDGLAFEEAEQGPARSQPFTSENFCGLGL